MPDDKQMEQMRRIKGLTEAIVKILKESQCTPYEAEAILKRVKTEVCTW